MKRKISFSVRLQTETAVRNGIRADDRMAIRTMKGVDLTFYGRKASTTHLESPRSMLWTLLALSLCWTGVSPVVGRNRWRKSESDEEKSRGGQGNSRAEGARLYPFSLAGLFAGSVFFLIRSHPLRVVIGHGFRPRHGLSPGNPEAIHCGWLTLARSRQDEGGGNPG